MNPMQKYVGTFTSVADRINSWSSNDVENVWELSGLHEGDIMIHPDSQSWKNGLLDASARWPGGIVPYFVEEDDFGNLLHNITTLSQAILLSSITDICTLKLIFRYKRLFLSHH